MSNQIINIYIRYYVSMLAIFFLANFFVIKDQITTIWILNFISLLFVILNSVKNNWFYNTEKYWLFSISLMISELITLLFHSNHILDSMKSIGLNLNIFVGSIYIPLIYGLANKCNCSHDNLLIIFKSIYYGGVIASIYNIKNIATIILAIRSDEVAYAYTTSSFLISKNTFGIFLGISISCGIYLFRVESKKNYVMGMILQFLMLLSSFCRSGLLFLGVFLLVFVLSKDILDKKMRRIIIISSISAIGIFAFNPRLIFLFKEKVFRLEYAGDAGRSDFWKYELSNFQFGIKEYLFGLGSSEINTSGYSYMHNILLELFMTGGIIKLLFYVVLILLSLNRIRVLKGDFPVLGHFCLSVLIGYIAFGMFESVILFELGLIPFLFVTFLFFIPSANINKKEQSTKQALSFS